MFLTDCVLPTAKYLSIFIKLFLAWVYEGPLFMLAFHTKIIGMFIEAIPRWWIP